MSITGGTITNIGGGSSSNTGGGSAEGRTHVVPELANFTWVNQGSSVATDETYGIGIYAPGLASANIAMLVQSTPTPPYTATMRLDLSMLFHSNNEYGMVLRNSSTGALQIFSLYSNAGTLTMIVQNWDSATAFNAIAASGVAIQAGFTPRWLRIRDDSTNRHYEWSVDGETWVSFYSVGRTSFITPDQVGVQWSMHGSTAARASLALLSWELA
jgi:hypothetical protein